MYLFRKRPADGFTLVELLVVIAVIGVLLGLLLPAVQSAREAGRRMSCSSHLKQLGLALHNYHSSHSVFPMAGTRDKDFSVQARLLPYVEEGNLHDLLDFDEQAFSGGWSGKVPNPIFSGAFATPIPLFLCASDSAPSQTTLVVSGNSYTYGGLNYMMSFGSGVGINYDFHIRTDGIFYQHSKDSFKDMIDGASKTVVISETVRSIGPDYSLSAGQLPSFPYTATVNGSSGVGSRSNPGVTSGGAWSDYTNSDGMIANPNLSKVVPTLVNWRGGGSPALRGRGISWAFTGAINSMTNGYLPPNSRIPDVVMHWTGYFATRSFHPGVANVVMGDGSVRALSDSMDTNTHQALHSKNGRELVGKY